MSVDTIQTIAIIVIAFNQILINLRPPNPPKPPLKGRRQ